MPHVNMTLLTMECWRNDYFGALTFHSWNQLYREGIQVPLIVRVPGQAGRSPQRG